MSTLYTNAVIYPWAGAEPARALRTENNRITHVLYGDESVGADKKIDLQGATVFAGLVDAHMHLRNLGTTLAMLNLREPTELEALLEKIRQAHGSLSEGEWLMGRGWDQHTWPGEMVPDRAVLDRIAPHHPVYLIRVDGHAAWVNSRALELAGIDDNTPDPPGGEIIRDEKGRATGVLIDLAMDLVREAMPEEKPARIRDDFKRGIAHCRSFGVTGVHDMGMTPKELAVLLELEKNGELDFRVTVYLFGNEEELKPLVERPPKRDGLVRVVGVKLFVDGALGSYGALMMEPYHDRPGYSGLLLADPDELKSRARHTHEAGYQLAIHAIGDRANHIALDAIAHAQRGAAGRLHRVEHAQLLDAACIERFVELGAVASMQPIHAMEDLKWAEGHLGDERLLYAYPWAQLERAKVPVPLGSDAPVEAANPWLGIDAALFGGPKEPSTGSAERRLSLDQAIRGYTRTPAQVTHEDYLGEIKPGFLADLTVVDQDPYQGDLPELAGIKTRLTVVDGVASAGQ